MYNWYFKLLHYVFLGPVAITVSAEILAPSGDGLSTIVLLLSYDSWKGLNLK